MKKYALLLFLAPLFAFADTVTVKLKGMHCGGCEDMVSEAMEQVPGVKSAKANHKTQIATLEVEDAKKIQLKDLNEAVSKLGDRYSAVEIIQPAATVTKKPAKTN